jgi:hypothetical protein
MLGCAAAPRAFQAGREADGLDRRTVQDGVYTMEQARRGESAAWVECFGCHSRSEWSEDRFMWGEWLDRRVGDLYTAISRSMPEEDPGRLTPQEYADIVAYMLWLSDVPLGETELPPDVQLLDRIFIEPLQGP